jgi:hypothetical protein
MNIKLYLENDIFVAGMTMRDPGEPEGGNMAIHTGADTESALENRGKLAAFLNCDLEDFVCAYQTHSDNFYKVTAADRGRGSAAMDDAVADTDALYTLEPGLLLCCFTADCVPVIFYNEPAGLIGVIHSGWMGTVKEITPRVLKHLTETERIDISDTRVFIGPAISREKFEVDQDVYDRFKALGYANEFICYNKLTHKYHIDNQLVVRRQCELHGISSENIAVDRTCTWQSPDGFSWREDKSRGRHMSFIIMRSGQR